MGLQVEWVRFGRPAGAALRLAVAEAKGTDPLAPVTVIVPSNHVGVATRRWLASGGLGPVCGRGAGIAAATFLTTYRLAELLGSPDLAASGRRPVSTPVLAAALRAALAGDAGVFAPVAHHPATVEALVGAYRELRELSPSALAAVARAGDRAADVVRIHRRARERLASTWYDEQDLMDAAGQVVREDRGAARQLGALVVYLPQRLPRTSAGLLAELGRHRPLSVLAATTGDARADGEVLTAVGRLAGADVLAPPHDPSEVVDRRRTRIVTASDADDEVRSAVRAVMDAVTAGTPLDRIAVLHGSPDPYARLAHEQLAAAGIPTNGAAVVPLTARLAARSLLGLLALPEQGFRRQDFFAWLTGAPVLHAGRWAPANRWERLSREAGVVAGRADWEDRLAVLAEAAEAEAAILADDPEELPWKAERARRKAVAARDLARFAVGLIDDLGRAAEGRRRWSEHARWAAELLDRVLGGPAHRGSWPEPESKAAERVEEALARLATLDGVEGPVPLDVFARTLELELDADLGRVGRFGEGVLVGSVAMGIGLDLDLVVVLGLAEGTFPATVHDDSVLPDLERERAGDELPLRRQRVDRQHRELLAALAGASRQVLTLPRGDLRRSNERVPSRWVLELASALGGERWWSGDLLGADRPWIRHVASYDAGLRRLEQPATAQEHRLRTMMAVAAPLDDVGDPTIEAGAAVIGERRSPRFTRFDGNLSGLPVPSPAEAPTSATRLERWVRCPYAYLVQDILRVEPVENPEEQLRITPRDRGELVHQALELFVGEVLRRTHPPDPDEHWSPADRARMAAIAEALCAEYERRGLTGRPLFWRRDRARIVRDLDRILVLDSEHRAGWRTTPVAAELAFGLPGSPMPAVPVPLADGRVVHFRGKADRVDEAVDGTLHVIDYKTGKPRGEEKLSEDDPLLGGRKLQLPVYGEAARLFRHRPDADVIAEYWFVSDAGGFARRGYRVTEEVMARTGSTLDAIVGGIASGVFPNHPAAASTSPWNECWFCDPDNLGVTELRRSWERKRLDPALWGYAEMAEPNEMEDAEVEAIVGG
ncbi:MAG TPA: PD-(D/E)XK nuclease family protein [Acidimicrobiales bacterium]